MIRSEELVVGQIVHCCLPYEESVLSLSIASIQDDGVICSSLWFGFEELFRTKHEAAEYRYKNIVDEIEEITVRFNENIKALKSQEAYVKMTAKKRISYICQ
jgi:hypothetical protein